MINQFTASDVVFNSLLKVPDIKHLIQRAIWWQSAEEFLANYSGHYLFCRLLMKDYREDQERIISICGEDAAREALKHAPPGEFFKTDWEYWNRRLGNIPIPAPPKRFSFSPDATGPWA